MKEEKIKESDVGYKRSNYTYRLILIILAICLCLVSLVAVTFGWFTSEDESFIHISSGEVKIEVYQADDIGEYIDITDGKGDIFGYDVWEPNQTRVVFFKIKSNSNIRIKYTMRIDALDEGLLNAFEYVAFEGRYFDPKTTSYKDLAEIHGTNKLTNGIYNTVSGDSYVYLEPGEEHYYVLALHMLSEADNSYKGQSFKLDLNVLAVQGNYSELVENSEAETNSEETN